MIRKMIYRYQRPERQEIQGRHVHDGSYAVFGQHGRHREGDVAHEADQGRSGRIPYEILKEIP